MEEIKYMPQGTCNGKKTAHSRALERLEAEHREGEMRATLAFVLGLLIGAAITALALI